MFIANLGSRYTDEWARTLPLFPCFCAVGGICYTQRIPLAARRIDDALVLLAKRR